MIVDPWGTVVVDLGGDREGEPSIGTAEIDFGLLRKIRAQMPLQRRT